MMCDIKYINEDKSFSWYAFSIKAVYIPYLPGEMQRDVYCLIFTRQYAYGGILLTAFIIFFWYIVEIQLQIPIFALYSE